MKTYLIYIIFLAVFQFSFSINVKCQTRFSNGISCQINNLCADFIGTPYEAQIPLIKSNYSDYFGWSLSEFDQFYPNNINQFEIKFDGLGCVYPNFMKDIDSHIYMEEYFVDYSFDNKEFTKVSFYRLFWNFEKNKRYSAIKNIFKGLFNRKFNSDKEFDSLMSIVDYPEFCSYWNSLILPDIINGLNSAAKDREVICFIHGYNAPYSLAKIQSIEVAKRIAGVKPNKSILFLQVYWPSGNRKFALFSSDPNCCNYSNMEDRFTKKMFSYVSNRSYLGATTFREILNGFDPIASLKIITHSHGATFITTTLINTYSKMGISKSNFEKSKSKYPGNRYILSRYNKAKIPTQKIQVFMNAPAIPGTSTFMDWDIAHFNRFDFWVGINEHDNTLLKKKIPICGWLNLKDCFGNTYKKTYYPFRFSALYSSTSLGCNYWYEADATLRQLKRRDASVENNFHIVKVGYQKEHDFFCYLNQTEFTNELNRFILLP